MKEKLFEKVLSLLEPYENRYNDELDNVHWVEKDYCSCDYDYCSDCIDKAVYDARKEYLLEQRRLPINMRDKELAVFTSTYNYGGGYEDDGFAYCERCGRSLDICILPNIQVIQDALNDLDELEDGYMTDRLGWRIHWLIYNEWGANDKRHKDCHKLTIQLANKVIELFNNQSK